MRVDVAVARHPKARRLARELGLSTIEVVGGLSCFWAAVMELRPDGCLDGIAPEDVDFMFDPDGKTSGVLEKLRLCGLVDHDEVHEWLDFNGHYVKDRERKKKKPSKELRGIPRKSSVTVRNDTVRDETDHLSLRSGDGVGVVSSQDGFDSVNSGNSQVHSGDLGVDEWFETVFWERYPRKKGKDVALRIVKRVLKGLSPEKQADLGDAIMAGLEADIDGEWRGRDMDKIPYPATWLNQRRWTDAAAG